MKNAAGDKNCDHYIRKELEEARIGIPYDLLAPRGEVPTTIIGVLNGWGFTRAWYYWVARAPKGAPLAFDVADQLHDKHGQNVRVDGHCGAPAPREWFDKPWHLGVPLYHVDTQAGLNALAEAIRVP